jgi:tRNA-2-methylthio-N6-dimethylallyladenosine synthase
MNYSDAERLVTVLKGAGYESAASEAEADIVVVVACSVRQTAIDRIYGKTKMWDKKRAKNPGFKTVLSGCVLPGDKKKLANSFDLIFDLTHIQLLVEFINPIYQVTNIKQIQNSKFKIQNSGEYLSIVPKYESTFRAYVPIMTGCDNFCSYCAVPLTRGREKSRPQAEILAEIRALVDRGYKEITLLGQNVNSYGISQKANLKNQNYNSKFINLLKEIDLIPGDYRVYFYSNHPKDVSDELINTLPELKHFPPYLHLPLQSGNDNILREMNRRYTVKQYLNLVKKIRERIPDLVLTTDIMVGYPGENEAKFLDTVEVMKKAKFEMAFIAQYSPRAGTLSAKKEDNIPKNIKNERFKILTEVLRDNLEERNKRFVGEIVTVLIDEQKSDKYYGRTEEYKVVEITPNLKQKTQKIEVGRFYKVEITKSGPWKLFATLY